MVLLVWDLNSSSTTITAHRLLSHAGGDKIGSSTLLFTPRWCMFGLIQEYHRISTLPTSHNKYNEWSEKVKIGIWALKWSSQHVFHSRVGTKLAWPYCPLFTSRLSEFGLIWAIHISSTLSMSHCKYNEWFCKLEIWIHHPQPSPHPGFWVMGGDDFGIRNLRFTPKTEYVWIDSRISHQLIPSNLSS